MGAVMQAEQRAPAAGAQRVRNHTSRSAAARALAVLQDLAPRRLSGVELAEAISVDLPDLRQALAPLLAAGDVRDGPHPADFRRLEYWVGDGVPDVTPMRPVEPPRRPAPPVRDVLDGAGLHVTTAGGDAPMARPASMACAGPPAPISVPDASCCPPLRAGVLTTGELVVDVGGDWRTFDAREALRLCRYLAHFRPLIEAAVTQQRGAPAGDGVTP